MFNVHNRYYVKNVLLYLLLQTIKISFMKRIPKSAIKFSRNPFNGVLLSLSDSLWYFNRHRFYSVGKRDFFTVFY